MLRIYMCIYAYIFKLSVKKPVAYTILYTSRIQNTKELTNQYLTDSIIQYGFNGVKNLYLPLS